MFLNNKRGGGGGGTYTLIKRNPIVKNQMLDTYHMPKEEKFSWLNKYMDVYLTGDVAKMLDRLGSTVLWLIAFPGENSPNFSCIALGQESYLI